MRNLSSNSGASLLVGGLACLSALVLPGCPDTKDRKSTRNSDAKSPSTKVEPKPLELEKETVKKIVVNPEPKLRIKTETGFPYEGFSQQEQENITKIISDSFGKIIKSLDIGQKYKLQDYTTVIHPVITIQLVQNFISDKNLNIKVENRELNYRTCYIIFDHFAGRAYLFVEVSPLDRDPEQKIQKIRAALVDGVVEIIGQGPFDRIPGQKKKDISPIEEQNKRLLEDVVKKRILGNLEKLK